MNGVGSRVSSRMSVPKITASYRPLAWPKDASNILNRGSTSNYRYIKAPLLDVCHCWWTSESPRAHVAKFYGRLRLIRSVWRASKFSVFKIDWNCNFVGLLHHPFWSLLFNFLSLYTSCLAKDHWWEQYKSSDIEQQPPFGDCKISNIQPQNRGGTKPTGTSYNFDKVWSGAPDGRFGK